MPSILLFGATGLIGSHLVVALKMAYPEYRLIVYNRNTTVDDYLTATVGVDKVVHGTFSESEKIASLAAEHDVVINSASSWDIPLSKAIMEGLKRRYSWGRGKATLIHISGAGNFVDGGKDGKYNPNAKVWNDNNEEDMRLINPKMLNGGPDTEILTQSQEDKFNTYIIFPSVVYGASVGPVKAPGVIQLLMSMRAKEFGYIPYVGEGSALFNSLHVKDCPPFILKVLDHALANPEPKGSVYSRCYIIGSQDDTWKDISKAFAKAFYAKGLIKAPVAKGVPLEEAGEGELPMLMAAGMAIKNDRAKALGFKPTQPGILEHIEEAIAGFDF